MALNVLSIVETTYSAIQNQLANLPADVDVIEWRLDILTDYDFLQIQTIRSKLARPVIFTLRSRAKRE